MSVALSIINSLRKKHKESGQVSSVFMKGGRRSLRVGGWCEDRYLEAMEKLIAAGCEVEMVTTRLSEGYVFRHGRIGGNIRLHILEK